MFTPDNTACLNDYSFGPVVVGCRGDFDFTLKFEKIFFSILPACVFIAAALPRALYLYSKPKIVGGKVFRSIKFAAIWLYASLRLALLILVATTPNRTSSIFIASSSLELLSALCMATMSHLEHSRSPRPSILMGGYLLLTLLLDIVQARSFWLSATADEDVGFARVFTVSLVTKAIITTLESRHKRRWLSWKTVSHSPEETTGPYGLSTYMWLFSLFLSGYKKILGIDDLFPLDQNISTGSDLQKAFHEATKQIDFGGKPHSLLKVLAKTLAVPLLLPIAPRIALMGFTFSQPFLIEALLDYLQRAGDDPVSDNYGYGLIGAAVLVYTGIAVSSAVYWYLHERCLWMTRGCLAGAVYRKTTRTKLSAVDDSGALTLMSTDVERIRYGFLYLHDFWANTIEVGIACWLLQRKLSTAFLAPIVIVLLCLAAAAVLGSRAGPQNKAWVEKIQHRVAHMASTIGNMKHLKISGLTAPVEEAIQAMRVDEVKTGSRFRFILTIAVTIAFTPLMISPVAAFAVTSSKLDVTTMFTSYSYILLVANPLTQLFQSLPSLLGALSCLSRIQDFLEQEPRDDFRQNIAPCDKGHDGSSNNAEAVTVHSGSFGWADKTFNVRDVSIKVPAGKLTLLVGPVASGKSTLCKALLGETPFTTGRIVMGRSYRRVGYCDQTPFVSNATIRANIVGFSPWDSKRYQDVVEATMLHMDFLTLAKGDLTKVGSNGITLSGGQKQRVAMARALYLESDLLIFDDVLSGLDADTEEQVFQRIFGSEGLLKRKGATVLLCTHSVKHLPTADHIIALGSDGTLVEEGGFSDLVARKNYIHSLQIQTADDRKNPGSITPLETVAEDQSPPLYKLETTPSTPIGDPTDEARRSGDKGIYRHYFASIGLFPLSAFFGLSLICGFLYNWPTIWFSIWTQDRASEEPVHSNAFYIGLFAVFQVVTLACIFACVSVSMLLMISASGTTLHKAALRTIIHAPLGFFTTTDSGVTTNLFSQDMTLIDQELPMALMNVVLVGFVAVGMAAIVATSSPYVLVSYPFFLVVLYLLQKFYLATSRQIRLLDLEAKSPLYTHFIDTMRGVVSMRAFGTVDDNIRLNNELLDTSQRPAYLLAMVQHCLSFALNMLVTAIAAVVVSIATQMRSHVGFTGASLVTIMSLGENLSSIIRYYTLLETSIGAVSRLRAFSENVKSEEGQGEDCVPPESWPAEGRIEINGVSASYGGKPEVRNDDELERGREGDAPKLALKDLNITIRAGEKVAICGRSGSGKSSLVLLLLKLLDPLPSCSENINIGGTPLHKIDRPTLRRRIIAVPQDAVFLHDGTSFRANLDPFGVSTEEECKEVLGAVDLWSFVSEHGGLEAGMTPDQLSQGQKQLFSLARAVLRKRIKSRAVTFSPVSPEVNQPSRSRSSRRSAGGIQGEDGISLASASVGSTEGGILLLDEVSSSVDRDTERAMQDVIAREFRGYTIVMVSHRLEMVMDFDRVIVMDTGSVVEVGPPKELVRVEGGRFRDLCLAAGGVREE